MVDLTISVRVNFAKTLMHFLLISLLSSPVMATIETEIKRCGDKLKKSLNGDSTITITDRQCPLSGSRSGPVCRAGFSIQARRSLYRGSSKLMRQSIVRISVPAAPCL